ncbi:MAG TPA: CapA family protein [Gaiellaceae bacterium]|nr:CapA family protein [Gaiellaceae bacterium]
MPRPLTVAALVAVLVPAVLVQGGARAAGPTISIAWAGDIAMVSSPYSGSFFSSVKTALRGDLVIGNLEGTLTTGGSSKCGPGSTECFAFHAPPSYARLLRQAGFTLMNLANNHADDYGAEGQRETLDALRSVHLLWTGKPGQVTYTTVHGMRVAVVGFAPYPWAQSLTNLAAAQQIVRRAAAKADVVIAVMHAGAEGADHQHVRPGTEYFLGENRGDAEAFSHRVIDAGADLVVGSGPHVLRGMEWYHGRLIAYSLGNFLGAGTLSIGGILGVSAVLHVTLGEDGEWVGADLAAVRLVSPGVPVLDPSGAAHAVVRTLSREDFGRNAMRVSPAGTLLPPAWRTG